MNEQDRIVASNLRKYLDKWRKTAPKHNTKTKFADKLKVSPVVLAQWLSESDPRPIPDGKYAAIAEALNIDEAALRQPPAPTLETAYALVSYRGREAGRSIDLLKHAYDLDTENIVKEAATVYGNKGGILKLQATTQHEIGEFLLKLGPYCDSTTTMFVMSDYHWQRQQDEDLRVLDKISHEHHPLGDFIEKVEDIRRWIAGASDQDALMDYFHDFFTDTELRRALNGELRIRDPEKLLKYPTLLALGVQSSLRGLVVWDQRTPREKEKYETYLAAQVKRLKEKPSIQIQRVFVTCTLPLPEDLVQEMRRQHEAGIEVFYLSCQQWQATRAHTEKPLDFGLFDDTRLWIHDPLVNSQELRTATLWALPKSDEMIARYKRLFEANLGQAERFG